MEYSSMKLPFYLDSIMEFTSSLLKETTYNLIYL